MAGENQKNYSEMNSVKQQKKVDQIMAQEKRQEVSEVTERCRVVSDEKDTDMAGSRAGGCSAGFKLNVHAPEFVPRSVSAVPAAAAQMQATIPAGYFYPYFLTEFAGGGGGAGAASVSLGSAEWFYFADQQDPVVGFLPDLAHGKVPVQSKNTSDVIQKIVKQVEYQFSDTNLVASDFLMKIMNKDPEGYVPMSVISSWKKIKSLGASNQIIIKALRTSPKLVVSDDGKKVRRKHLFTESDREEVQLRTVIVENLPEDYTRQNLEKMFSAVGSVKSIRICHPQETNSSPRPSKDLLISNKLHALVEYETADQAEKAVEKLNDERNWRKGLRVRTMLRRSPRSVIRSKRSDYNHFEMTSEDEQSPLSQASGSSQNLEQLLELSTEENQGVKRTWGRGRAKPSTPTHISRRVLCQPPSINGSVRHCETPTKQSTHGPRMPDGTRGFTIGRGRSASTVSGCPQLTPIGICPIQL